MLACDGERLPNFWTGSSMLQVELTCCERTVDSLQQTVDSMQGKSTPVLPQLKELAGQFEAFSSTEIKGKLLAFTEFVHQSSKTCLLYTSPSPRD